MNHVETFSLGELGIAITPQASGDIVITFRDDPGGDEEVWTPAPDGYPVDGSRDVILWRGRYYVPREPLRVVA